MSSSSPYQGLGLRFEGVGLVFRVYGAGFSAVCLLGLRPLKGLKLAPT